MIDVPNIQSIIMIPYIYLQFQKEIIACFKSTTTATKKTRHCARRRHEEERDKGDSAYSPLTLSTFSMSSYLDTTKETVR